MKTQFKLNSVVPHGVGSGPESGAIDLIYEFLLHKYGQDIYRYININQIGEDLSEFVMKEPGNKIHVNIRYPAYKDFEKKNADEKNRIRLDVIHQALQRIANYESKLDLNALEKIKKEILDNNFDFYFDVKVYPNKKSSDLLAKIIVHPQMDKFDYYVVIEENGKEKCRQIIFSGGTNTFYFSYYFHFGKWKSNNEIFFSGTKKEVETHLLIDECKIEYVNLTPYDNPPYFTLLRKDISEEERKKAKKDWEHSLPPATLAVIRMMNEGGNN